jgi:AraC-like DNA-binding protein
MRWTNRVGSLVRLPDLLRELDCDPVALFESVGLDADALDDVDAMVEYAAIDRLLAAAVRTTGRTDLGLRLGERYRVAELGILGELVSSSATLGEAWRTGCAYHRLNSDSAAHYVLVEGGEALLGYAIYQPGIESLTQAHEAAMACVLVLVRELTGARLSPLRVQFAHAAPADTSTHRRLFGSRIVFDAERTALVFPASVLDRSLPTADRDRFEQLEKMIAERAPGQFLNRVYRALRVQLARTAASGDEAAQILEMHRRTFNRRLKAEGTTFQRALHEVRFETARQLLEHSSAPLVDISASLGFAEASAFSRAFKRWSGTTPAEWRERSRACAQGARSVGSEARRPA